MSTMVCELPRRMNPDKDCYEVLGFHFYDIEGDNVLCRAKLPDGWTTRIKDKYYTSILDEKGNERACFFYKGINLERNAHMILFKRFTIEVKHLLENDCASPIIVYVYDRKKKKTLKEYGHCQDTWCDEYRDAFEKAEHYLYDNFPNWENPLAYWNE